MAEYIEKHKAVNLLTALENEFQQFKPFKGFEHAMYRKLCETEIAIGKLPAADVVPVVHAKWIHTKTEEDDWGHSFHHWHCPVCGWFEGSNPEGARKYCSGCGAKMKGVVDNA